MYYKLESFIVTVVLETTLDVLLTSNCLEKWGT